MQDFLALVQGHYHPSQMIRESLLDLTEQEISERCLRLTYHYIS